MNDIVMNGLVEVVDAGIANSIQDLGRIGYRHMGIAVSGSLDPLLARCANIGKPGFQFSGTDFYRQLHGLLQLFEKLCLIFGVAYGAGGENMHCLRSGTAGFRHELPHFFTGLTDHAGDDVSIFIQCGKSPHSFAVTLEPMKFSVLNFRQQHPKGIGTNSNSSRPQWKHLFCIYYFSERNLIGLKM